LPLFVLGAAYICHSFFIVAITQRQKAYLQLHTSVFLWGFTAILGELISIKATPLVWYRIVITCCSLLVIPGLLKKAKAIPQQEVVRIAGIGCLVALHWVCFYSSIKVSNVSVALSCLATTSFFTAILEPIIRRKKHDLRELLLGMMVIPGIYLIYYFTENYTEGIILGILAALFSGLFTILNKQIIGKYEPRSFTFVELGSGLLFLTLLMPLYLWFFPDTILIPTGKDWLYLFTLSVGCTALPYVLALRALNHLSAFAAVFTVNLEPVYGIIMAVIFFNENEKINNFFYLGTLIILASVFLHPLLKKKELPARS
jgi:drug/metabolite transporter (DMT)-like permease